MHFGIISPPVPGHLNPFGALGRELKQRGHRVTLLHMEDVRAKTLAENLEFLSLGSSDHPPGSLPESLKQLGRLSGFPALRFTIRAVQRTTEMFCRDAPPVIRSAGIDALLADQTEPAGCTLAEHLKIPFLTICNALNLNEEPDVPPPFTPWRFQKSTWARARNNMGYRVSQIVTSPIAGVIAVYRERWGLPGHRYPSQSFSKLAQISQLPPGFDYPRSRLPSHFYYTGPLRNSHAPDIAFPWSRLNGKPLIYASLGTLQNGRNRVFAIFAEACATLDVQLVLAGVDVKSIGPLPGDPIAVGYAPQLAVLKKAALTLTHAGLNTVLDSLSCGVPMVAVPINYEQPSIAERIRWSGSGKTIRFSTLTADKLNCTIKEVLSRSCYRESAVGLARNVEDAGGVVRAADIVEEAMERKTLIRKMEQAPRC